MRYYSDVTKKIYESAADLNKAEDLVKKEAEAKKTKETKLKNERAARAKVVDTAFQNYFDAKTEAEKKYRDAHKLLKDFIKDYGSYHTSISDDGYFLSGPYLSDLIRNLW